MEMADERTTKTGAGEWTPFASVPELAGMLDQNLWEQTRSGLKACKELNALYRSVGGAAVQTLKSVWPEPARPILDRLGEGLEKQGTYVDGFVDGTVEFLTTTRKQWESSGLLKELNEAPVRFANEHLTLSIQQTRDIREKYEEANTAFLGSARKFVHPSLTPFVDTAERLARMQADATELWLEGASRLLTTPGPAEPVKKGKKE